MKGICWHYVRVSEIGYATPRLYDAKAFHFGDVPPVEKSPQPDSKSSLEFGRIGVLSWKFARDHCLGKRTLAVRL